MSNIALQLNLQSAGSIDMGNSVLFDILSYSYGDIDYDIMTGVITFNLPGRYNINWWVSTQSSLSPGGPVFALSSSQGDFIVGNSPSKTGTVAGMGIVNIDSAPVTLSLISSSTGTFQYAPQVPMKAALTVIQDEIQTESMYCFATAQFSNILSQMITAYPSTSWTIFSTSLASYSGVPLDLYSSPNAYGPGILRLVDVNNDYESIVIENITAVYPGAGTFYDPSFTYLAPPDPLPPGCDTNTIAAIQSYLPIGTSVNLRMGPSISASGNIYRNEYGVIVLSNESGETPIFVFTPKILRIFTTEDPLSSLAAFQKNKYELGISIIK